MNKLKSMLPSRSGKSEGKDKEKKNKVKSWKANMNYNVDDAVKYRGRQYKCIVAHRSARTVTPLTAAENWSTQAPTPEPTPTPTPEPTPAPVPTPDSGDVIGPVSTRF